MQLLYKYDESRSPSQHPSKSGNPGDESGDQGFKRKKLDLILGFKYLGFRVKGLGVISTLSALFLPCTCCLGSRDHTHHVIMDNSGFYGACSTNEGCKYAYNVV